LFSVHQEHVSVLVCFNTTQYLY